MHKQTRLDEAMLTVTVIHRGETKIVLKRVEYLIYSCFCTAALVSLKQFDATQSFVEN